MKSDPINTILAGLVVLILGMCGVWWMGSRSDAAAEKAHKVDSLTIQVHYLRKQIEDTPPGGKLELLMADLRKAEAELAEAND